MKNRMTDTSPIEQYISNGNRPTEFDASEYVEDLLQSDLDLEKVRSPFALIFYVKHATSQLYLFKLSYYQIPS